MASYRIVRHGERYDLQKWFDRSPLGGLLWKAGWYTHWATWDGGGWSREAKLGRESSVKDAVDTFVIVCLDDELPSVDTEPVTGVMTDGEALRLATLAAPADDAPKLVYADWLEENGFPNTAARIRIRTRMLRELRTVGHTHSRPAPMNPPPL